MSKKRIDSLKMLCKVFELDTYLVAKCGGGFMQVSISKRVYGQLYVHILGANGNAVGPDAGDGVTSWIWTNLVNGGWTVEVAYQAPTQVADGYTLTVAGGDLTGYGAYPPASCQFTPSAMANSIDVSWGNMPTAPHWAYTIQVQVPSGHGF